MIKFVIWLVDIILMDVFLIVIIGISMNRFKWKYNFLYINKKKKLILSII